MGKSYKQKVFVHMMSIQFQLFNFSVIKYSISLIQKMGNQLRQCNGKQVVTQSFSASLRPSTEPSYDLIIKDSPKPRKPKAFRPKKLPPVKTMKDLQPLISPQTTLQLEDELLQRVLTKKTTSPSTSQALEGCLTLVQKEIEEIPSSKQDVLSFLEDEIDQWVKDKSQSGEVVLPDKIDRGKLFKRLNISLASFIRKRGDNVKDFYDFKQVLGQGTYGKVYRAVCKRTQQQRAIKVLKRKASSKQRQKSFLSEFDILSELDHPNIVKLFEIFFHKGYYYVVMEFCRGGSLIDMIRNNKSLSERTIANLMRQLLSVLAYLHSKDIVHRDIKLENIVALNKQEEDGNYSIKIIDFGLAIKVGRSKRTPAGTRCYMSPQAFNGSQNPKSDVWSAGVCLFLLFVGKFPFQAGSLAEMREVVISQVVSFANKKWSNVSRQAKNLILLMLEKRVQKRLSAAKALQQPWFSKSDISMTSITYDISDLKMLEKYQRGNNFISIIENYLSLSQISQIQRDRLGNIFRAIDTNNDGTIEASELIDVCQNQLGVDIQVDRILEEIDSNNSGRIDFNQFLVAMYCRKKLFLESSLKQAFKFYDMNHDGYLERKELLQLLEGCQNQEIDYLLQELDKDGDERVSEEEFLEYVNKNYLKQ